MTSTRGVKSQLSQHKRMTTHNSFALQFATCVASIISRSMWKTTFRELTGRPASASVACSAELEIPGHARMARTCLAHMIAYASMSGVGNAACCTFGE